jgi:hypothetical protein
VEIGAQQIVDKLLALSLFGPASLILEDNVVVPSPLEIKILGVEQRVTLGNVILSLLLFLCSTFAFLEIGEGLVEELTND